MDYFIVDQKHGKAVVAGDVYNGNVYHQDPQNRLNARWALEPSTTPDFFYIRDMKHLKCLVAGDDGRVYHQEPEGRASALWELVPNTLEAPYYYLRDAQHKKCLVAGDTFDGNLYLQDPQNRRNACWRFEPYYDISQMEIETLRVTITVPDAFLAGSKDIVAIGFNASPIHEEILRNFSRGAVNTIDIDMGAMFNGQYPLLKDLKSVEIYHILSDLVTTDKWKFGTLKVIANGVLVYDWEVNEWISMKPGNTFTVAKGLQIDPAKWAIVQQSVVPNDPSDIGDFSHPFSEYTFLTSHNAFATYEDYWCFQYMQTVPIPDQLSKYGVRGLMLDIYDYTYNGNRDIYLCHGTCEGIPGGNTPMFGMQTLKDCLSGIITFLNNNPKAVITIIFESYVEAGGLGLLQRAFSDSGAQSLVFYSDGTQMTLPNGGWILYNVNDMDSQGCRRGWPTLDWMIRNNKRLVVFSSKKVNGFPYVWDYCVENSYSDQDVWKPSAPFTNRRESSPLNSTDRALFIMNHFPEGNLPVTAHAGYNFINSYYVIMNRVKNKCLPAANRLPNFLAVDFVEYGLPWGPIEVVKEINNMRGK